MKALSIRQPWAWAILHAGKRIENRERKDGRMPSLCSYRGPLLIHASAGCTHEEWRAATRMMVDRGLVESGSVPRLSRLDRGGIVGVCTAVNHIEPSGAVRRSDGTLGAPPSDARDFLAWHAGGYGLVLADVRPLPFVPFKGALGFFDVPVHLVPQAMTGGAS